MCGGGGRECVDTTAFDIAARPLPYPLQAKRAFVHAQPRKHPASTQQAPSKHPLGNSRRRSSKHMAHGVLCRQPAGRGLLRPWPFIRDPSDASGSFPCHGVLASAPRATAASTAPAHFTTPSPSTPPLRNNAVQRDEVQSRIRAAPSWGVASVAKALCA